MTELPMVPSNACGRDRAGKPGLALAFLLVAVPVAVAAPIRQPGESTPPSATALLLEPVPTAVVVPGTVPPDGVTGQAAVEALAGGHWLDACRKATAVLARQVPDVDALGVFAVCGAVGNDRSSVEAALARLREVENPAYYRLLAEGVLQLQDGAPDKAEASFRAALQARPGHALAHYFEGEALYARRQPAAAVAAFDAALESWPKFAPAMTAKARLMAGPKASQGELRAALTLAEQATKIEPENRAYWQLLADLCRRTGDDGRANAITLMYLRPVAPPASK